MIKKNITIMCFALLAACQTGAPSDGLTLRSKEDPPKIVAKIARAAQDCWFKSKDRAFRTFRMSNEVNSYAGRPRFLLVKRKNPNGLPHLVVQAERAGDNASGKFTRVQAFGPLLQTGAGKRIVNDVRRWSSGSGKCS